MATCGETQSAETATSSPLTLSPRRAPFIDPLRLPAEATSTIKVSAAARASSPASFLSADARSQSSDENYSKALPPFLRQSRAEIRARYDELDSLQRRRLLLGMQATESPSPWLRVSGEDVMRRNRYINVDPFVSNRVKLRVRQGQSDYINASPILLKSSKSGMLKEYIATQGPKEGFHGHLWHMLWHETSNPAVVVMLTPTHEAGREKCFQYFPQSMEESVMRVDESDEFGVAFTASVTLLSMTNDRETNCTIRKLEMTVPVTDAGLTGNTTQNAGDTDSDDDSNAATSLSISESNSTADASNNATVEDRSAKKSRIVWHLLYEAWPDYFLPEDINRASLLSLIRLSADRADSAAFAHSGQRNPRIVHCSAGVGRSGTFIALDFLLTELEEGALDAPPYGTEASGVVGQSESEEQEELLLQAEEYDPVFAVVDQLRRQRMMMVQSEAQFAFLYEVLREKWLERRKLVGDFSDES